MRTTAHCRSLASCFGALLLGSAAWISPLHAQPEPIPALALEWEAPGECPSSSDVLAETKRLLGGPPTPPGGEHWTARATVMHRGAWSVSLETRTPGLRHRLLEAQTCRGLADATALILALMIDPRAVAARSAASTASAAPANGTPADAGPPARATLDLGGVTPSGETTVPTSTAATSDTTQPSSPPRPESPAPPTTAPPPSPGPRQNTAESETNHQEEAAPPTSERAETPQLVPSGYGGTRPLFLALPLSLEIGPVPGIDYGVGGALGLRVGSVRIEASITDWLRSAVVNEAGLGPSGGHPGGTFRMLYSGALEACYVPRGRTFELGPCAEVEAGVVEATGLDITSPATNDGPWVAAGIGAFAAITAGDAWAFPLHVDIVVPLAWGDFRVNNVMSSVYRPSVAGGRLALSVEYRF